MANERLRDALLQSGLTPQAVAAELGVDPKTVERWITLGRNPYRRHRHRVAALVKEHETYLWPDALHSGRQAQIDESEIVHVYSHRACVPLDLWMRLFNSAQRSIDILVYSGLFLTDQTPQMGAFLRQKGAEGVAIRVLLGDPACPEVAARGEEEGVGEAQAAKIRNALVHYESAAGAPGVSVHLHASTLYNSVYRFDDEMLVNAHVYGFPAGHAPVMHLRELGAGILFQTYAESFEKVWSSSGPAWP